MRRRYHSPHLTEFGDVTNLTERVGDHAEADTFYSAKGIVIDVGSTDSCEIDQHGNIISNPACPFPL